MNRNNNPLDTITSALSPSSWLRKLGVMLILMTVLAIDKVISNLDYAFQNNTSWFLALYEAYTTALYRAFGTVYPFIMDVVTFKFNYFNQHLYGTIALSLVFLFLLIYIVFQPVSLFFDLFDNDSTPASFFFRFLVTLIIVIFVSAIIYYIFGDTGLISNITQTTINETTNSTINNTITNKNTTIINMI